MIGDATVAGLTAQLYEGSRRRVVGEWYPPWGVIILEFNAVFRHALGGVVLHVPPVIEKRTKQKYIIGCAHVGGGGGGGVI